MKPDADKKSFTVSTRVTPEMYDKLKQLADSERRTVSNLALILIERGLYLTRSKG